MRFAVAFRTWAKRMRINIYEDDELFVRRGVYKYGHTQVRGHSNSDLYSVPADPCRTSFFLSSPHGEAFSPL